MFKNLYAIIWKVLLNSEQVNFKTAGMIKKFFKPDDFFKLLVSVL